MKVVLTAFGGKLRSEPMDWPEDKSGQDIYLILDMERPSVASRPNGMTIHETGPKRCRFEFTNSYAVKDDMPAIYKLVAVE